MDTDKTKIKTLNPQGRGHSIYISKREMLHLGVRKRDSIIIDLSMPKVVKIMSINTWRGQGHTGNK